MQYSMISQKFFVVLHIVTRHCYEIGRFLVLIYHVLNKVIYTATELRAFITMDFQVYERFAFQTVYLMNVQSKKNKWLGLGCVLLGCFTEYFYSTASYIGFLKTFCIVRVLVHFRLRTPLECKNRQQHLLSLIGGIFDEKNAMHSIVKYKQCKDVKEDYLRCLSVQK